WVGANGRWITVETLKAPAGVTQNQLRHTLGLKDGTVTTVHGVTRWVSRDRGAVLLFGPDGRSLLVNGSPALAGGLTDVAAALAGPGGPGGPDGPQGDGGAAGRGAARPRRKTPAGSPPTRDGAQWGVETTSRS